MRHHQQRCVVVSREVLAWGLCVTVSSAPRLSDSYKSTMTSIKDNMVQILKLLYAPDSGMFLGQVSGRGVELKDSAK